MQPFFQCRGVEITFEYLWYAKCDLSNPGLDRLEFVAIYLADQGFVGNARLLDIAGAPLSWLHFPPSG